MHFVTKLPQFFDQTVSHGPGGYGFRHILGTVVAAEQFHHSVDVFRTVATLKETVVNHFRIRTFFFKLQPGLLVAERGLKSMLESLVVFFRMRGCISTRLSTASFCALDQ